MRKPALLLLLAAAALGALATPAGAAKRHFTTKKAIWGPATYKGKSQFPIYHDLGAGIWHTAIAWTNVAPTRPANPRDPSDPAYDWPADLDSAIQEAAKYKIRVAVQIRAAPGWSNGG